MGQVNILKNKYRFSDLKKRKQKYKQNMFVMYNFTDRGLIWLFNNCLVKSHKVHKSSNSGFIGLSVECNLIIRKKRKNSVNFSIFYNIYSVTIWAFCIAINEDMIWIFHILTAKISSVATRYIFVITKNILYVYNVFLQYISQFEHLQYNQGRNDMNLPHYCSKDTIFVVSVYFWYLGIFVLWQISIYKGYIVYYFLKCQN